MLIMNEKILVFSTKTIYFADYPFDIDSCDGITFHFCRYKIDIEGFHRRDVITSIIDLTQDLDTIWKKISKSHRYGIKRACELGIDIKINEKYDDFYQIYKSFIQKKGIVGIKSLNLETIKKYGTLFVSEYNGEIIGGNLYLEDDINIQLWLSVSKRLDVDDDKARLIGHANRLVHWKAIRYAKEKQLELFDFGGLWSKEESDKDIAKYYINSFKLGYRGDIVDRYIYQKKYSKTYELMSDIYILLKKNLKKRS